MYLWLFWWIRRQLLRAFLPKQKLFVNFIYFLADAWTFIKKMLPKSMKENKRNTKNHNNRSR